MIEAHLPATLFSGGGLVARRLEAHEVPALQALFEANPEYFLAINGRRALPDEAQVEFEERPPAYLSYGEQQTLGFYDEEGTLQGMATVVSNLCAPGVWHVTLFLLATRWHGQGVAAAIYQAMEYWSKASGASWLRLGVVIGNTRAERFWTRRGFVEVRRRLGVDTGGRVNDLSVRVKALAGGALEAYWALVPRDHPESDLP
ncbi:MAG: GNAT family N-acetyltransferase [Betaproteobacteria bacterium]|nr:GNAT family N-acetyltransferase [Betaproteobacteria bacterium]